MAEISLRLAVEGGRKAQAEIENTAGSLDKVDSAAERVRRSAVDAARGLASISGRAIGSVARTAATGVQYLAAGLGTLAGAGAVVGIKTAAGMEQASIAFTTMLGSGEKAQSFLSDLSSFAAKTPFDMPGLTTAASSLISAGIDADKVIPIMTSLGNATSGMGTGAEGIQRATIALQQMNAAQKITGEDLNQLRDAGIPVFDLLAAATGKSTEEVAGLAAAGKLGKTELDQLMGALETGQGLERFAGLMDKQSQSLNGLWSSFQDTVGMGLAGAMQPLIPLLKDGVTWATQFATDSMPALTSATSTAAGWIRQFIDGFSQTGPATTGVRALGDQARTVFDAIKGFVTNTDWSGVWSTITGAITSVKDALAGVDFSSLGVGLKSFTGELGGGGAGAQILAGGAQILGAALSFLSTHMDTIVKYMPAIVAGYAAWRIAQQAAIVVAIANIPLQAGAVIANFALASSNRALAAAIMLANGQQRAGLATRIADFAMKVKDAAIIGLMTIRYLAYQVAIGVVTAVTKVAAAGQWLLNAAMTANPIGLVIAAILLLVGGIVLAYKKSDTFRGIVDGLWGKLKDAWGWIKDTAIPIMKVAFAAALDVARDKFNSIKDGIGGFIDKVKSAWEWVKKLADRLNPLGENSLIGKAIGAVGNALDGERATGGPVRAGGTYLVGEQGPEVITPTRGGYVSDHRATLAALTPATLQMPSLSLTRDDYGLSPQVASELGTSRRIEIPVVLNGREIARAVYDDADQKVSRS